MLSPRNVRSCGCLRTIFRTLPLGHLPRFCSFVISTNLISQYDCKEVCAPSQSQGNVGASARLSSQDGVPQQPEAAPLSLPQLDRLVETSFTRDESSASKAGVAVIPSQFKVTQQILIMS